MPTNVRFAHLYRISLYIFVARDPSQGHSFQLWVYKEQEVTGSVSVLKIPSYLEGSLTFLFDQTIL